MNSIERILSIIANLITVIQVFTSIAISLPNVEIRVLDFTGQMVLPTRFAAFLILGCFSAFAYGKVVSSIYWKSNEQVASFLSIILSTSGAWFALLAKKIFLTPVFANEPVPEPISIIDLLPKDGFFIFFYAGLFLFALHTFRIPITNFHPEDKLRPKAIFITTILPFLFFFLF